MRDTFVPSDPMAHDFRFVLAERDRLRADLAEALGLLHEIAFDACDHECDYQAVRELHTRSCNARRDERHAGKVKARAFLARTKGV